MSHKVLSSLSVSVVALFMVFAFIAAPSAKVAHAEAATYAYATSPLTREIPLQVLVYAQGTTMVVSSTFPTQPAELVSINRGTNAVVGSNGDWVMYTENFGNPGSIDLLTGVISPSFKGFEGGVAYAASPFDPMKLLMRRNGAIVEVTLGRVDGVLKATNVITIVPSSEYATQAVYLGNQGHYAWVKTIQQGVTTAILSTDGVVLSETGKINTSQAYLPNVGWYHMAYVGGVQALWNLPGVGLTDTMVFTDAQSPIRVLGQNCFTYVKTGTIRNGWMRCFANGSYVDQLMVENVGNIAFVAVYPPQQVPVGELTVYASTPTVLGNATVFSATWQGAVNPAYTWDFGDGNTAEGQSVAHSYTEAGNYLVQNSATENGISVTKQITVEVVNHNPTAVINVITPEKHIVGEPVEVSGANSYDPDGHSIVLDWNVLSNAATYTTSATSAFITAQEPGVVTITLSVEDAYGAVSQPATRIINIYDAPIVNLTAQNSSPVMINDSVYFTATISGGTNVNYTWNYGDGTTGSGMNSTHSYTMAGTYTATVTASNTNNVAQATTLVIVKQNYRVMLPVVIR